MDTSADEHGAPASPGVEAMVLGDPDEFRTLAYASAIGGEFEFDLLADAMGVEPEALAERIERLGARGILKERPGGGRFAFADDSVRGRVYQSMTESRLRVIHLKIAQTLERRHPEPGPQIVADLGRHFFLGRVPEKAWRYNLQAAREAREQHRPDAALHDLERARRDLLSLTGDHALDLSAIDEEVGNIERSLGHFGSASEAYLSALDRIPPNDRAGRLRLLLARAEALLHFRRPETAGDTASQALAIARALGDLAGQAGARRILARVAREDGEYLRALDEAMIALDLYQRVGDRAAIGLCCTDIAEAFARLGPTVAPEGLRWSQRAVEILQEVGDPEALARALVHRAGALGVTDPQAALEDLARARSIAEKGGSVTWVLPTLITGTEFRLQLGELEEAEREIVAARRLLERIDSPLGRHQLELSEGLIAERRGRWEEAEAFFREAGRTAQTFGLTAERTEAEFRLAHLRFKTRDLEGARAAYQLARAGGLPMVRPGLSAAFEELGRQLSPAPAP